jgi:nucleoside-triphosphatase THEP1
MSRPEKLVVLVCGIPGSGKSTAVGLIVSELSTSYRVLECHLDEFEDECRRSESDFDADAWRLGRQRALYAVQQALLSSGSTGPEVIVVDDVFELRGMRREIQRLARDGASLSC